MYKKLTFLLFTCFLICFETDVLAVEPEYFYVRGVLKDTQGNFHAGLFDFKVSLWSDQDKTNRQNEEPLWEENHSTTVNKSGMFELKVGAHTTLPTPFNYDLFQYIQLETKPATGESDFIHLDPRPDLDEIDRNPVMLYPYKPRQISNTDISLNKSSQSLSFNAEGQLTTQMLSNDLKTTLTSLEDRVNDLEKRVDSLEEQTKTYNSTRALTEIQNPKVGRLHYVVEAQNYHFYDGNNWQELGGIKKEEAVNKGSYHHNEIIKIHSRQQASPGIFYWDRTQKSYYVGMADGSLKPLFGESDLPGFIHDDWVDFRFANLDRMVIEKSRSVVLNQHNNFGLHMQSSQNNWSQAVALPEYSFDRSTERTFEFVFRTGTMQNGRLMFGLADADIDVDRLEENSFHAPDLALYMQENGLGNKLYGQNQDASPWFEIFEPEKNWQRNSFYKVVMRSSAEGGLKSNWRIERVKAEDWTMVEDLLYEGQSYNTANSSTLKPFILLGGNKSGGDSNDYHLTGFRVY